MCVCLYIYIDIFPENELKIVRIFKVTKNIIVGFVAESLIDI